MTEREIEVIVGRLYLKAISLQTELDAIKAAQAPPPTPPLAEVPKT